MCLCVSVVTQEVQERASDPPRAGVTGICETWILNLDPQQERRVPLFATEPL